MIRFDRRRLLDPALPALVREGRARALAIAEAALAAVDARPATERALARLGPLDGATAFAFGKASVPMLGAALAAVSLRGGLLVALEPPSAPLPGIELRIGGHPDPAPDAAATGSRALALARSLGEGDLALCLVSGGGSAMLELPRDGVTLAAIRVIARSLMRAGASIEELNAVRCGLSQLKGGGLAAAIAPARCVSVIVSDVPGHPAALVASGPTLPPLRRNPYEVLERYGIEVSTAIRNALRSPPADPPSGRLEIAADSAMGRRAAVRAAARLGIALQDRAGCFSGEARALGRRLAPGAWVWGGETTVTVRGRGRGGRNQEVALAALAGGWGDGALVCFGTDGVDGSSDAAGALVDRAACERAHAEGLEPARFLADNASHAFFERLGTALRCGPTGTNVADLCLAIP